MPLAQSRGTLYVVATPIGNLADLSDRMRDVLRSVAVVAAEDTRHTGKLLQFIGSKAPTLSLHEHNEAQRCEALLQRLEAGDDVALVSDAGTPLISDPGFVMVRAAVQQGLRVVPVAGPCAAIVALSVAGLPTDRFVFEGFLPGKPARRREYLTTLRHEPRTLVFYEAPHRCVETLTDLVEVLGAERQAAVCRELTKLHESLYYGTLSELAQRATTDANISRGEIVLVVAGAAEVERTNQDAERVLDLLLEELPAAQAAKLTARLCGVARADMYELAVARKRN